MPRCSSTRRQSLAPSGGGLCTRTSAACSARRMACRRAAIAASSRRHAARRSGSPRMVATSAAPCCGGDEWVSRIVRRSCCPSLSAMGASWQLPTQRWGVGWGRGGVGWSGVGGARVRSCTRRGRARVCPGCVRLGRWAGVGQAPCLAGAVLGRRRRARGGSRAGAAGQGRAREGDEARALGVEPHVLGVALHRDHLDTWHGARAWRVHGTPWNVHGAPWYVHGAPYAHMVGAWYGMCTVAIISRRLARRRLYLPYIPATSPLYLSAPGTEARARAPAASASRSPDAKPCAPRQPGVCVGGWGAREGAACGTAEGEGVRTR